MSSGTERRDDLQAIASAVSRGLAFLEQSLHPSGEVPVVASESPDPSVFPTALAAHSLSFVENGAKIRERLLDFLSSNASSHGLWRHWAKRHPYHRWIPPDLDDTACASAALVRGGREFPPNRELILSNRDPRGLFYTWKLTEREYLNPIGLWTFFKRTSASRRDVDAVVNANVVFYLGDIPETKPVIEHLLRILREGREQSCDKWYENPYAVWYFFSRALGPIAPEAGEMIASGLAGMRPANALEHALAACSLLYWNREPSTRPILETQLESGGWPRAGLYHGGRKRISETEFEAPHPDTPWWGSEQLTTVFCLEALARVCQGAHP